MVVHVHFNDRQYAQLTAMSEADGVRISAIVKMAAMQLLALNKPRYKMALPKHLQRPIGETNGNI